MNKIIAAIKISEILSNTGKSTVRQALAQLLPEGYSVLFYDDLYSVIVQDEYKIEFDYIKLSDYPANNIFIFESSAAEFVKEQSSILLQSQSFCLIKIAGRNPFLQEFRFKLTPLKMQPMVFNNEA